MIPRSAYMNEFLDKLYEKYSCIEDYFHAVGIDDDGIAKIRAKMF